MAKKAIKKKAIKKQAIKVETIDEIAYLLSTKANQKELAESITQLEKAKQ